MLKIRKEKCRDSAVWRESWSSNHNCFPLSFILSLCLTENSPWLLSGWGSASFHLYCALIGWCCTALHCRWGMTPTSFTSNQNNTTPCSPLYIHHKHHHWHSLPFLPCDPFLLVMHHQSRAAHPLPLSLQGLLQTRLSMRCLFTFQCQRKCWSQIKLIKINGKSRDNPYTRKQKCTREFCLLVLLYFYQLYITIQNFNRKMLPVSAWQAAGCSSNLQLNKQVYKWSLKTHIWKEALISSYYMHGQTSVASLPPAMQKQKLVVFPLKTRGQPPRPTKPAI